MPMLKNKKMMISLKKMNMVYLNFNLKKKNHIKFRL